MRQRRHHIGACLISIAGKRTPKEQWRNFTS